MKGMNHRARAFEKTGSGGIGNEKGKSAVARGNPFPEHFRGTSIALLGFITNYDDSKSLSPQIRGTLQSWPLSLRKTALKYVKKIAVITVRQFELKIYNILQYLFIKAILHNTGTKVVQKHMIGLYLQFKKFQFYSKSKKSAVFCFGHSFV